VTLLVQYIRPVAFRSGANLLVLQPVRSLFLLAALTLAGASAWAQTDLQTQALARIFAQPKTPDQALFRAIEDDDAATFARVLKGGVNIEATNSGGETPLYVAAEKGRLEMVKLLLAHHADSQALTPNGESVLHAASMIDSAALMTALIDAGAPINHANNDGETPLLWATMTGTFMAVKALADAGADLDIADTRVGNTPLHAAAWHDDILLVHYLLSKHVRTDIRNKQGLTAFDLAKVGGRMGVLGMLRP